MLDPLGLRHGVLGVAPLVREQGDSVTRLEARGARDGDLCSLLLNEPEDGVRGGIAAVVGFHSAAPNIERTKWGLSAEVFLYIKLRRLAAMLGGASTRCERRRSSDAAVPRPRGVGRAASVPRTASWTRFCLIFTSRGPRALSPALWWIDCRCDRGYQEAFSTRFEVS